MDELGKLVLSHRSQFLHSRRFFSPAVAKLRSTTQRFAADL
jgi:hypothetical protein